MAEELSLVELGRRLEAAGYQCSEHPQFGGVAPGAHGTNSWHYRAKGDTVGAIDVNVPPPGDHPREREMLEELWEALVAVKGSLEQVIYRGRGYFGGHRGSKWGDYGHPTHLHLAATGPIVGFGGVGGSAGTTASPTATGGRRIGVLREGTKGPDVKWWQQQLRAHNARAMPGSKVDGVFGARTEAATKSLQKHVGVAVDGVVGPATLGAFRRHLADPGHPHNAPRPKKAAPAEPAVEIGVLRKGASGPDVGWWQRSLVRHDTESLSAIDNSFGSKTEAATKAVQRHLGVGADGVVGPKTLGAFREHVPQPEHPHNAPRSSGGGAGRGDARSLSDEGVAFIGRFEGFSGQLYNDPSGHATIGFGHLVHRGPIDGSESAEFKQGISRERGLEILREDAATAAAGVHEHVEVGLDQAQFDALVSFTFNLGAGSLSRSTLLRRLNAGDYASVPSELRRWNKAGGRVLSGLTRRREAEGRLFSSGVYE